MLVAALGVWGCARGPANNNAAQTERLRSLESKCAKLEDDYKAVAGARDQARRRVAALEEDTNRLQKEVAGHQAVVKERDNLKQMVDTRTSERDQLQQRCDRIKKGIQSLLGQEDPTTAPSATAAPVPEVPAGPTANPS
jgi:septal ring factor EnvC (AmiA/AmiB activator)